MKRIDPVKIEKSSVNVPGSKSYTHRFFIISALSEGISSIIDPLESEDTLLTLSALKDFGVDCTEEDRKIIIRGTNGKIFAPSSSVYLKGSGTSMRLLTAVSSIGEGRFVLTGTEALCSRPVRDLIDALSLLKISVRCTEKEGYPPLEIIGNKDMEGGKVNIKCGTSSQYLSGLLIIAPYTKKGLDITVTDDPVSKPYIDITIDAIEKAGIKIEREGYGRFIIKGGQTYKSGIYHVEPDASHAGYFWAAAAVTGASITVKNLKKESKQGDIKFPEVLVKMGCKADYTNEGITVTGGRLVGIEADMSDMPDMVPTLAVVAAFAQGDTVIKNIGHLKVKESDRLNVVASELKKIGIYAEASKDKLLIKGGKPKGAVISTFDDHRIAMSFAVAGLRTSGIIISDEKCVDKSFPQFWNILESL